MKRGIVIESHASRGEKGEGRMRKLTKSDQGSGFKCEEQCKMRGVLSSERKDLYENS